VTFDAAGKDLRDLADAIGTAAGVEILVDPGIREEVTLRLVDVDWREAVDAIARATRTRVVEEDERRVRLVRPPSIRMELHDADVRTVLLAIAAQAGVSIVIPSDVQGKVTLSLVDVPWIDALDAVASCSGHVLVRGNTHDH
jgi:type II secretory pathway component HofQ